MPRSLTLFARKVDGLELERYKEVRFASEDPTDLSGTDSQLYKSKTTSSSKERAFRKQSKISVQQKSLSSRLKKISLFALVLMCFYSSSIEI